MLSNFWNNLAFLPIEREEICKTGPKKSIACVLWVGCLNTTLWNLSLISALRNILNVWDICLLFFHPD